MQTNILRQEVLGSKLFFKNSKLANLQDYSACIIDNANHKCPTTKQLVNYTNFKAQNMCSLKQSISLGHN